MEKLTFNEVVAKLQEEKAKKILMATVISAKVFDTLCEEEDEHYCTITIQRNNGEDTFILKSSSDKDFLNGIYGFSTSGYIGMVFLAELFNIIGYTLEEDE